MDFLSRHLLACGILAAAFCPWMALAQEKHGGPLIVPGQSIGEIRLGMELREVGKKLGSPAVGDAAAGTAWEGWFAPKDGGGRGYEMDVRAHATETGPDKSVEAIRVESPFFHTREGVSTQSSLVEIWQSFPGLRYSGGSKRDKAVEIYEDDAHGFAIEVRRTFTSTGSVPPPGAAWGVCQAVMVFRNVTEDKSLPSIQSMRDLSPANGQ